MNFFLEQITAAVHSPAIDQDQKINRKFGLSSMKITKLAFDTWTKELAKLHRDLEKISSFEEKTKDASELMTAVVIDAHTIIQHDDPGMKKLDASLGVIVNL